MSSTRKVPPPAAAAEPAAEAAGRRAQARTSSYSLRLLGVTEDVVGGA